MKFETLPWLILFLPLLSAAVITLFTQKHRGLSAGLSIGAVVISFALSVLFVAANGWEPANAENISRNWLSIGDALHIDFGFKLDTLSLVMIVMVTGVASLIHIYSVGYMHDDPGFSRFFACLSLFTFSMLGIVLSNNFLQTFIFWELVGVSSYLLIGFWYEKPSAADAAKKAFITNRLGDLGFIIGILMVWATLGSLRFETLQERLIADPKALGALATVGGLLIFCGAVGKSAQFPLHVWLPDAMEGPTPVSALIHAATMVAAGVYMLCRVFFILNAPALEVIAYIGGFTALLAALIAIQQNDIKRILAYSTLSQLGYMVMAVGLAGPTAAMFHLTTHAFFKALLFLGSGSVILAMHHEQDIWHMGALRKKTPVTFWTFIVGTLALSGLWPFSGFFSKDSILALAHEQHNNLLFGVGVFVAFLTTFYMFRLVFVVFFGSTRTKHAEHAHESPGVMTWPLRLLAVLSLIGGFIGLEALYGKQFSSHAAEAEHAAGFVQQLFAPFQHAPAAAFTGIVVFVLGLAAAYALYAKADKDPLTEKLGWLSRAMRNRFYFDELYEATVIRLHDAISAFAGWLDRWIIEGFCIGLVRGGTDFTGRALRLVQTGNLQTYALLFVLGVAVLLYFVIGK
ncbi:MAG TPA: NADH-quinone oxidoreductase subunit L [Verrucomicrobiae bacterium]|nr:NADH-quinone oxidoreductase subunit L [Verrucomicrobiae bacterium]